MHKFHIATKMNGKKYWLKTYGEYGNLKCAEWTLKLRESMKFTEMEEADKYYRRYFLQRHPTVEIDRQFDVYGAYSYGYGIG